MGFEEAAKCAKLVAAKFTIPYHPTFSLEDPEEHGIVLPEVVVIVPAGEKELSPYAADRWIRALNKQIPSM